MAAIWLSCTLAIWQTITYSYTSALVHAQLNIEVLVLTTRIILSVNFTEDSENRLQLLQKSPLVDRFGSGV